MEYEEDFQSMCCKIHGHQFCYSLAASSLRQDSLLALAVAIVSLLADEIGIGKISLQGLVQQAPYLGPAVPLSSVFWNYLCQFKNNTLCNKMIALLNK